MKNKNIKPAQKKTDFRMLLGTKLFWVTILMAVFTVQQAIAEVRKGIVVKTEAADARLYIHLDTDGNRIADTYLVFPSPYTYALSSSLETFAEKGMQVVFDDTGHLIARGTGDMIVDGYNTISMDGVNMTDLFPRSLSDLG